MEGGALQLAAYGKQDLFLTGNPQMTFFIGVYKRYTNFAIEQVREYFDGLFNFGRTTFCRISREGDLINQVFLFVKLPALQQDGLQQDTSNACYSASWINSIGHALIRRVEIEIGGVVIDTHYGQWLEIWNELTLPDDKQDGYNDMVGKHEYFNSTMQGGEQVLYIPLQFWFCRNIGLSLPLVAIQQHDIRFIFDIRPFDECVTTSDGTLRGFDNEPRIEEAFLYVDHIFLDDAERRAFVNNKHTYLIEQLQVYTVGLDFDTTNYQINLDFKLPTKEIIWVIRSNTNCNSSMPEFGNQLFNFSDRLVNVPGIPQDPMLSARLQLEGNDLFKERLNKFFREVQPYQRHTRVPQKFIYVYSFALEPENWRPTGTINLSQVDTFTVNMTIKPNLVQPQAVFYGINYNIFKVEAGMAGVMYLN